MKNEKKNTATLNITHLMKSIKCDLILRKNISSTLIRKLREKSGNNSFSQQN